MAVDRARELAVGALVRGSETMDRSERYFKLGFGALGLAMVLSVACSSEFKDCEDARNCASASDAGGDGEGGAGAETQGGSAGSGQSKGGTTGSAGDAAGDAGSEAGGAAGSGGEDSGLCATDDDCNDHLECNGTETCVDQQCQPGESPCTETPPEHCDNACAEDDSGPLCGFQGVDADGDGYLTTECVENPGDDCNDSPEDGAGVNPGAGEVCNTIDDDCDGLFGWDDEMRYDDAGVVLVEAVGATVRGEPSIAAAPGGGFGLVWSDAAEGNADVHYRYIGADGSLGQEIVVDSIFDTEDHSPDLAVWGSVFKVAVRGEFGETVGVYAADVAFDGSDVTQVELIASPVVGRPQVSSSKIYVQLADDEVRACDTNSCVALGVEPAYADTFHVSSVSSGMVFDRGGDIFTSSGADPILVDEDVPEIRTNPVAASAGIAYRHEGGVWIGIPSLSTGCERADGIPIDMAVAPGTVKANVLMWNVEETAFVIQSADLLCTSHLSAVVVEENGNSIDSGSMAIDENGVVAVVWSSEDPQTGEWRIMGRFLDPAACE